MRQIYLYTYIYISIYIYACNFGRLCIDKHMVGWLHGWIDECVSINMYRTTNSDAFYVHVSGQPQLFLAGSTKLFATAFGHQEQVRLPEGQAN